MRRIRLGNPSSPGPCLAHPVGPGGPISVDRRATSEDRRKGASVTRKETKRICPRPVTWSVQLGFVRTLARNRQTSRLGLKPRGMRCPPLARSIPRPTGPAQSPAETITRVSDNAGSAALRLYVISGKTELQLGYRGLLFARVTGRIRMGGLRRICGHPPPPPPPLYI